MWFESARVEAVRDAFPEWLAFLVAFLSHLGSVWFVAPAVVLAFWYLDPRRFASWIGIVLGCYAVMIGLKGFFETPRPGVDPAVPVESLPVLVAVVYAPAVEISTSSFPSGHAMAAVVVWTMLAIRNRTRARGRRAATTAVFATSVALASLALVTDGRADTAALLGGSIGGLLAWRYATPPREPLNRTPRGVLPAALGSGLLAGIAATLLVVDSHFVWLIVGLIGGTVVVGLPAFAARRPSAATFRGSTS
ncbi:phosphatase PAP2 family protein [Natronococcus sp.]|uniref:phosphatase PAP2 family protein n=1 Tax=Natronococcus sp. TaxID=35747 RepID=UPI003A4DE11E